MIFPHTNKKIVLHITPHLGGGVGRVLLNYLAKIKNNDEFTHHVLSLEYANEKAKQASKTTGFLLMDKMSADHEMLIKAVSRADIVLIHWWNHPLLYDFLVRQSLPPARIVFWGHISGFHAPYVFTKPVLHYPDLFVFTSPLSLDVPEVKALSHERKKALRTIWSTGGIEHVISVKAKLHKGFNVGYIGTVDYCKLHPNFLQMSGIVDIPGVKFIVCGGPSDKDIEEKARQSGIGDRFVFLGQVDNINKYLSEFDVFGYPLAPHHYGTCEQSLGESMAAGVPPVVFANGSERCIVENGVTGLIVNAEKEYALAIETLYRNVELRRRLSENAREAARQKYSLARMVASWEDVFTEILAFPKTARQWSGKYKGPEVSPHHVYLESLGEHEKEFIDLLKAYKERKAVGASHHGDETGYCWKANTRGTPQHYYYFFPEDTTLKKWSETLKT